MAVGTVWVGPPGTLGEMMAEILDWMRGDLQNDRGKRIIRSAINDAIATVWMHGIQTRLSRFIGADSPVTLNLAANTERDNLVLIPDPTNAPALGTVAGGALGGRTYIVGFTCVTESGSETLLSPTAQQIVGANNLLTVTTPGGTNTANSIGYNVYAGQSQLGLQNQQPVPFGTNWQEPDQGVQDYPEAQQQPPKINETYDGLAYITHMEALMPDNTHIAWNQADVDSELMRRLTRIFPSASPYQTYAWDILDGRMLEIRPTLGIAFQNRYWYVKKPLRLRYPQARIPYQQITGVYDFVKQRSIADGKASIEEYLAYQMWDGKANKTLQDVKESLAQENWAQNVRITPYLYG